MIYLPKNVAPIGLVADKQGEKFCHVKVIPGVEDYRLEATNGKIALILRGDFPPGRRPVGMEEHLDRVQGSADFALLPGADFEKFLRMARTEAVACRIGSTRTALSDGKDLMLLDNSGDRFPSIEGVFPKEPPECVFRLGIHQMIRLLKVFGSVAPKDEAEVTLIYYGKDKPIGLAMVLGEGRTALDGLIMPLT